MVDPTGGSTVVVTRGDWNADAIRLVNPRSAARGRDGKEEDRRSRRRRRKDGAENVKGGVGPRAVAGRRRMKRKTSMSF